MGILACQSRASTIIQSKKEQRRKDHPFANLCGTNNITSSSIRGFLSTSEAIQITRLYHQRNSKAPKFAELAHDIMDYARWTNQMVVSVQVGGMDGKSNDPMYDMFVRPGKAGKYEDIPKTNWMPLVFEPVPDNFKALTNTYDEFARDHGLLCYGLGHAAVSYDRNMDNNNSKAQEGCTFCHFDTSDTSLQLCKDHADWMKTQLGTLDCDYSKRFFQDNFEKCILQTKIGCGSVSQLMSELFQLEAANTPISILQLDVEGYEYMILNNLLNELEVLPPVLHFEHKVMVEKDRLDNNATNRMGSVMQALQKHGYNVIADQGEDYLALLIDPSQV